MKSQVYSVRQGVKHSHTVLPTSLWSTLPISKTLATENWLTCYLPLQLTSNTISPNLRTQMNFHYYLGMQCQAEPSNLVVFFVLASRCPSCPIFPHTESLIDQTNNEIPLKFADLDNFTCSLLALLTSCRVTVARTYVWCYRICTLRQITRHNLVNFVALLKSLDYSLGFWRLSEIW